MSRALPSANALLVDKDGRTTVEYYAWFDSLRRRLGAVDPGNGCPRLEVRDEGTKVGPTDPPVMDFVGSGVTVTALPDNCGVQVYIPGGGAPGGGGNASAYLEVYDTPGSYTWNKPTGARWVTVVVVGGGGGGSSGTLTDSGTTVYGGPAGAGGCRVEATFYADELDNSVAVEVGAGGIGGVFPPGGLGGAVAVAGTAGGNSEFGDYILAGGGGVQTSTVADIHRSGAGGSMLGVGANATNITAAEGVFGAAGGAGNAAGTIDTYAPAGGAGGGAGANSLGGGGNGGRAYSGGQGGGGGASVNAGFTSNGGVGRIWGWRSDVAGGVKADAGSPDGASLAGTIATSLRGAGGGGGGSSNGNSSGGSPNTARAGNGGAGQQPGGGGGGGGSRITDPGYTTGAGSGGNGGDGIVVVLTIAVT